jgi:hypothetical protein
MIHLNVDLDQANNLQADCSVATVIARPRDSLYDLPCAGSRRLIIYA